VPKRVILTQAYVQGYTRNTARGIQQVKGHYERRKEQRSPNECVPKIRYNRALAIIDSAMLVERDEEKRKKLALAREKVKKLLHDFLDRHPACRGPTVELQK